MKSIILMCHSEEMREEGAPREMWGLSLDGVMAAGNFFKNEIFSHVEQVYSSTHRPAYDTAMILCGGVTLDSELDDMAWDAPEGSESMLRPEILKSDAFREAGVRIQRFITRLLADMAEGESALAVSHPASILAYLAGICDTDDGLSFRGQRICSRQPEKPDAFILEFENDSISHIRHPERT